MEDIVMQDEEEAQQPKALTACGVCNTEVAKYKCAHCPLAYCSVACSRVHRDNHPPPDPNLEADKPQVVAEQPIPAEKPNKHPFSVLDDSVEIERLFKKYLNLAARLHAIVNETMPPTGDALVSGGVHWNLPAAPAANNGGGGNKGGKKLGRHNKNFWKERAAAKARGGGSSDVKAQAKGPWTKETGLRKGVQALRKARIDPTEDGDGVREYSELVLHLLARGAGEEGINADFTASVRQEVTAGDAALVEQLMKADGDM